MDTLIEAIRQVIGEPEFYVKLGTSTNYSWDYGAMLEYMIAGSLLIVVVGSVFKFIRTLIK